jgi:DNA-binding HxlR family transcriptional regulator
VAVLSGTGMEATTSTQTVPVEPRHTPAETPGMLQEDLCPVQETIRLVGRKWYLILLWELSKAPGGFNELKERAGGISAKMLSQSLSGLEKEGLVVREIVSERPLRVCYHLTEKARDLADIFGVLREWGVRNGIHQRTGDPTDQA